MLASDWPFERLDFRYCENREIMFPFGALPEQWTFSALFGCTIVDAIDRKILDILQADATVPIASIAEKVGLSAAPCWRRIKRLEDDGVIKRRVALVDRRKANVPMTVFVSVRTTRHAVEWLEDFRRLIADVAEIVEAWRLSGEVDYLLRIVVPDIDAYDAVYKRMINRLEFSDISSAIAMEEMKYTTAIPTDYIVR
jgi:Lrp/AsnC family transcriptional regulator, cysteine-sensing transcriptional activator